MYSLTRKPMNIFHFPAKQLLKGLWLVVFPSRCGTLTYIHTYL